MDHMRAGHDEKALFACLARCCHALLTKDILPLHATNAAVTYGHIKVYRQCSLPNAVPVFLHQP